MKLSATLKSLLQMCSNEFHSSVVDAAPTNLFTETLPELKRIYKDKLTEVKKEFYLPQIESESLPRNIKAWQENEELSKLISRFSGIAHNLRKESHYLQILPLGATLDFKKA